MSRKYYDKLMTGSGTTSKQVKSKFGEAMMKKMGWEQGLGLGKEMDGMTDCIQVKRREEGAGLGNEEGDDKKKTFKWNDAFWDNMYNTNIKKFGGTIANNKVDDESESSDDDSSSDADLKSTGSSSSEFKLEIIKSTKSFLKKPDSKKIKKDKKKKSDKKDDDKSEEKKEKKKKTFWKKDKEAKSTE